MRPILVFVVGLVAAVTSPAMAQQGPRVVKLIVSPVPPSAPPLPYMLLPHLRDVKPGNGAVFYQRSQSLEWWGPSMRKEVEKAVESLDKPWQDDADKKFGWFGRFGALHEIDYAARCENCDFPMLQRLRA